MDSEFHVRGFHDPNVAGIQILVSNVSSKGNDSDFFQTFAVVR